MLTSGMVFIMLKLQNELEKIEPMGYILLHGMKGFGKSSLIANTLQDTKLVETLFNNEFYWIKFGYERSTDEEILTQLSFLYEHIPKSETASDTLKSECHYFMQYLKKYFGSKKHRNALLILDDVCKKEFIDAFDFGCKTLVVTADKDVLEGKRYSRIEMNDGFTEEQTLGLFAKVLDTTVQKLPVEANKIHEECKGMPLLIAMLSAQFEEFKDDLNNSSARWRYYLRLLRQKDSSNEVIKMFLKKQKNIFDMCINKLQDQVKKYYMQLAIFNDGVNIMPKTLAILWNCHKFAVDEKMIALSNKSLAVRSWNSNFECYVYGVHDLLLCHLRNNLLTPQELKSMHRSFIEQYRTMCRDDYSKLPKDNYSYSYIGHHLELAELYDEFPKLYLDLNFIQAKIDEAGLSDTLIDLKRYRKYITNNGNEELEKKISDLERFLNEQAYVLAASRRKGSLDIIQTALNYSYQGFITEEAQKLANQRNEKLYFSNTKQKYNIRAHDSTGPVSLNHEFYIEISTISFTDDPNKILLGNDLGEVILFDLESHNQRIFSGFDIRDSIKNIIVSDTDLFLAISDSGTLKVFSLTKDEYVMTPDENYIEPLSPRQKQVDWTPMFMPKPSRDDSTMTVSIPNEKIMDAVFLHDDKYVAACTDKGRVNVWNRSGDILSECNPNQTCFQSITATGRDVLLHTIDVTKSTIVTYLKDETKYSYLTQYNARYNKNLQQESKIILFQHVPLNDYALILVTQHQAIYIKFGWSPDREQAFNFMRQERAKVTEQGVVFTCAAVMHDGQYLVIGDSNGFVNIFKADAYQLITRYKGHVTSLDTYWMNDEGYHLICGTEGKLIRRWKFDLESSIPAGAPAFDAFMTSFGESNTIAVETWPDTITIYQDNNMIACSKRGDSKIINLSFDSTGTRIVYVTEKGTVTLFNIEEQTTIQIMKLHEPTTFLKWLDMPQGDMIVCMQDDENLKVWIDCDNVFIVENTGNIISMHKLNDKQVLTISQTGLIKLWLIRDADWRRIAITQCDNGTAEILYTSLSFQKTLLSVLMSNYKFELYAIQKDSTTMPEQIRLTRVVCEVDLGYRYGLTCCSFSHDDKYLAVGLSNGDVRIISMQGMVELDNLSLHNNAISQLYWAPGTIDEPILLSVNRDELAWWNLRLLNQPKVIKRSRKGIVQSNSNPNMSTSPRSSWGIQPSHSADFTPYNQIEQQKLEASKSESSSTIVKNGNSHDVNKYWKCKKARCLNRPALLGVITLSPNYIDKVCVSSDFSNFLMLDTHGMVSNFSLFNYD
ncbi:apoptotic protease-activating factor 1 isoform X2 [Cephus cinctus]|uniref:Apoptotic protease-activating factor 1 isoform X2 n=1 Tax=Cephus cinctus TaxID=211228 RepID=A0AAJ7CGR1_CEPCN|nr:apoptotic protease-activating factor 1 isoform X2 [Cephus cinctus]